MSHSPESLVELLHYVYRLAVSRKTSAIRAVIEETVGAPLAGQGARSVVARFRGGEVSEGEIRDALTTLARAAKNYRDKLRDPYMAVALIAIAGDAVDDALDLPAVRAALEEGK